MISISSSGALDGSKHLRFKAIQPRSSKEFCDIITSKAWSPCIWEDGVRGKRNFLLSEYLALDFDDGKWSLMDALTWTMDHGYKAIIATTKSHQKEKVSASGVRSPAVDRFRMILPFDREIESLDEFEYNMAEVMKITPTDVSCKDGGRFYFPCTSIWQVVDGEKYPVKEMTANMRAERSEGLTRYKEKLSKHKENMTLPSWVNAAILDGTPEGERHVTAYKIGATLTLCGMEFGEIFRMCNSSNLRDIGAEELKRAISNGIEKALSDS